MMLSVSTPNGCKRRFPDGWKIRSKGPTWPITDVDQIARGPDEGGKTRDVPVKIAAFIAGELIVAALLAALLFIALLYQPVWLWIVAPLLVLAGLVAIIFVANRQLAWTLVFACPAAYTVYLLLLGLSTQPISASYFLVVAAYYGIGVGLFSAHLWLNAKFR